MMCYPQTLGENVKNISVFMSFFLLLALLGCSADNTVPRPEFSSKVIGFTNVPLDARKPIVRGGEAVLGNLVSDAILFDTLNKGELVDGVISNGGNIRFDSNRHPDGIYPAGELTEDDAFEILPFANTGIIVDITGAELKSTFERGVNNVPVIGDDLGSGAFLQVSKNFVIVVDTSRPAQIVDQLSDTSSIISEGERIQSILIDGIEINPEATYKILFSNFIANGGDSFVALGNIPDPRKKDLGEDLAFALKNYITSLGTVNPQIENRIIIN
ncbi:MAG: hypothetical protein COW84_08790 [Gammaproteobacteria bacterium CG22_combo_CG10-13_8_21_14_all_40_8]|nr:MAG: hypothetical protein COW84_08790 [Gammaproteobacteria bacterium CG22_combo_CG10-13_8_21_14_all_40_8]